MDIMSLADGQEWFAKKFHRQLFNIIDIEPDEFPFISVYKTPGEAGRLRCLARELVPIFAPVKEGVLWIYDCEDWSWPSTENLELFDVYRQSLNEERGILEAPFHIFAQWEHEQLEALLCLMLYFEWQGVLFNADYSKLILFVDGLFSICTNQANIYNLTRKVLQGRFDETNTSKKRNRNFGVWK